MSKICSIHVSKKRRIAYESICCISVFAPLVRLIHNKGINNEISSFNEISHGNKSSSFQDLLKNNNSVAAHQRNIQSLATKMLY